MEDTKHLHERLEILDGLQRVFADPESFTRMAFASYDRREFVASLQGAGFSHTQSEYLCGMPVSKLSGLSREEILSEATALRSELGASPARSSTAHQ